MFFLTHRTTGNDLSQTFASAAEAAALLSTFPADMRGDYDITDRTQAAA